MDAVHTRRLCAGGGRRAKAPDASNAVPEFGMCRRLPLYERVSADHRVSEDRRPLEDRSAAAVFGHVAHHANLTRSADPRHI